MRYLRLLILPLALLLTGCAARNASLTTRYSTQPPAQVLAGVERALVDAGYLASNARWGDAGGMKLEAAPAEQADPGTTLARGAAAAGLYTLFSIVSVAAGGEPIASQDVGPIKGAGGGSHCHAEFRVRPRDGVGSELQLWVSGIPRGETVEPRVKEIWDAVSEHVPLEPPQSE